jgi:hypothetical protein
VLRSNPLCVRCGASQLCRRGRRRNSRRWVSDAPSCRHDPACGGPGAADQRQICNAAPTTARPRWSTPTSPASPQPLGPGRLGGTTPDRGTRVVLLTKLLLARSSQRRARQAGRVRSKAQCVRAAAHPTARLATEPCRWSLCQFFTRRWSLACATSRLDGAERSSRTKSTTPCQREGRGFDSRHPLQCDVARHPGQPNLQSGFGRLPVGRTVVMTLDGAAVPTRGVVCG